jgi:two-component system response regulator RpaA
MQNTKKKRILIIEDDVDFRYLLHIHLSIAGYELELAEDGVQGGRTLQARPPDLVLSNLDMPCMDGFELLSLMRSDERTASIPVILLSCLSDRDTMANAIEFGAADVLTKPVPLEDLKASIQACLAKVARAAADESPSA